MRLAIRKLCPLLCVIMLCGCGTMTKVGTTGATAAVGAAVAGPVGAVGGALIGDTVGEVILDPILNLQSKKAVVEQKVDGFWPLLAKALEVGGWIVGLFILIPLVAGIVMPQPKFRRRTQRRSKK